MFAGSACKTADGLSGNSGSTCETFENFELFAYPINAPASHRRNTSDAPMVQMLSSATKARGARRLPVAMQKPSCSTERCECEEAPTQL